MPSPTSWDECSQCGNCGYHGGDPSRPFQFCACEIGQKKQEESPTYVDELNRMRDRLMRKSVGGTVAAK